MLTNYFKIAIRGLWKNPIFSSINIAGLAIGLTCSSLILLWVNDEIQWDGFHLKQDRIFKVMLNGKGDDQIYTQPAVPLPLVEELRTNERDIKYIAPTDWGGTHLLTVGEKKLYKKGYFAGDDFLKIFNFPIVEGSGDSFLKDPTTMVITRSTAKTFFSNEDPIGKVIRVDNKMDLTVTGVVEDVPFNSTFQFDCLLPFAAYVNHENWVKQSLTNWGSNAFNLYIRIEEGADIGTIEKRVKNVIAGHLKEGEEAAEVTFHALKRWRLYSEFKNGKSVSGSIVFVRMFSILAVFILVIACINFMNLSTARSERRAREVGIRKSVGSRRKDLIAQFLGETFFIALVSSILAVGIVQAVLPLYNDMVSKHLLINFAIPEFWLITGSVVLITSFIAGSYPAFYLSSFQPAAVLKGKMHAGKKGSLPRKVMVILQFFFSITLIISTMVIYNQLEYLRNRPTGYDKDKLIMAESVGEIGKNYNVIKEELIQQAQVTSMTQSSSPVTGIYAFMDASWPGKRENQRQSFATVAVGYDYTKTMGIHLIEGRDFSERYNDSLSIMLNKVAVDYMGLKQPLGEKITWNEKTFTIVGVLENVVMQAPHRPVDPMMVLFDPSWEGHVTLRLPEGKPIHESLADVEQVFKKYNPAYPFTYVFVDDEFNLKFTSMELIGRLSNLFAVLAILISCLGLFGLAAFTAEQRTKEIGIRKVMGATVPNVVMLISKDFTRLILLAFILAAPLSWWALEGWLERYPYRISIQWWILVSAGGLTVFLALVTVSFQAIKAAIANPVNSLRSE